MNQASLLSLLAVLGLASACAPLGVRPSQPAPAETQASAGDAGTEASAEAQAEALAKAQAALPKQPLTPDILFRFLVAEVAGQRGALGVARSTYLDLARQTRDPRVARRAAEVAAFSRDAAGTLEATRLWAETEKDSVPAQQTLAALLLSEGRFDEAEPHLRVLLRDKPGQGFLHISALSGRTRDPVAMLGLVERLAADYPMVPEARFAVAQSALAAGKTETSLRVLEETNRTWPGWEPAALLRAQILAKASIPDAVAFLRTFLAAHPGAKDARLAYARALVSSNQFNEARTEFTRLTTDFPQSAEVSFAAGLLSLQMGDVAAARDFLTRTLDYHPRDVDAVHYYLGQTAEHAKAPEVAAGHYAEVKAGAYLVPARVRQASLLARAGRGSEAQALLAATQGENDAQKVRLIQARAELLRETKDHAAIFEMLSEGLKRYPDAPDLLYDRAMAAEKLNQLDVLETDLRRVIALRPNDAQAYNALGYTLADRTDRLAEAIMLLEKALSLAPEDPFILDSVGWAQFRSGNLARAQEFLERAYNARPDPEIAAHLGEVLWARGERDAAGKLWQTSLQTHPQNEVLLETLRRLQP